MWKLFGQNESSRGISAHIKQRASRAKAQLKRLATFRKMNMKTRIHLYKSLVRLILEYPIIPTYISQKTGILKLQRVQNIAIRRAARAGYPTRGATNENLHKCLKMDAINTSLFNQAANTWNRLARFEPELVMLSEQLRETSNWEHLWWPTVGK